jgi:hypothetical protein
LTDAPGFPGISPRWTSSAKDGVGTALSPGSAVWFTHSHGILNEIYYPGVDKACTRDCGLIVTDGLAGGFFAEEKRDTVSTTRRIADGVPLFTLTNTSTQNRFVIEKQIIADPVHDCVLQQIRLIPAKGVAGLRLFALLAPHLVNGGPITPAGSATIRAQKCCLRPAAAPRSPSPVPPGSRRAASASRAFPTAGRFYGATARSPKPMTVPPMATSPWPPRSPQLRPFCSPSGSAARRRWRHSRPLPASLAGSSGRKANTSRTGGTGKTGWNRSIRSISARRIISTGR